MARYRCEVCDYAYDESVGAPREGFPPGTAWAAIPDDWTCPDCGVREKVDFRALDTTDDRVLDTASDPADG